MNYEDIINDLEGQARRLVAFTGLPWNEACLTFHKTKRQIRTHSTLQVRKPIYRDSMGAWQPYAKYLGPLMNKLGICENADVGQQRKKAG